MKKVPQQEITIWLDEDVLNWLKKEGTGYQTRLNRILISLIESDVQRGQDEY